MTEHAAAPVAAGFSPYVLYRRGTLGLPALAGTVPARTWRLLDAAERARVRRRARADALTDVLHAMIPMLAPEHRRDLLKLRRDVHNDRRPAVVHAGDRLPPAVRELLARWLQAREEGEALWAEAETTYSAELAAARKSLADVAIDEDFRCGVQLSGEDVYREIMAYAADPFDARRKPSRRRRAESTITSFAYRVVFKPSPFGSFTEIGAQPWRPTANGARGALTNGAADDASAGGSVAATPGDRVALARLSVGLLAWMAHQLRRVEGADELLRVRLNNSLTFDGDRVVFARRPLEGSADPFQPDRVVVARNTALVGVLTAALGAGDLPERELRDRLVAAGLVPDAAAQTIDQLVNVGLCHRGVGLPDQTTSFAGVVARRLRDLAAGRPGGGPALRCAEIFERLQQIEDGFAAAPADRRTELLAEVRELVGRFAEVCGCPPPAPEAMRAVMYEDVGTRSPALTWRDDLLLDNVAHVELVQRLLPVLDDATVEKLGLYRLFVERYGDGDSDGDGDADSDGDGDRPTVDLLEFFRVFAELSPSAAGALMSGVGDPYADRVRQLRGAFFDLLRAQAEGQLEEVRLDQAALSAFVGTFPPTLPQWRSTAYRVQFGEPGSRHVVVNGVTTGHGVFFSRYCDLLTPGPSHQWDLREALREHITHADPRQTDLTAVLGLNFNLHPQLAPIELVYPGSVAGEQAQRVLTLADVAVRPDPGTRRLELVAKPDGEVINLVPLNFLYPAAAPVLYRFLCAFAPTRTYRGGLWEQVDRFDRTGAAPGGRPRVLLGDLVLDRRSWRIRCAELPDLGGLERQDLAAIAAFDRWRRQRGIPRYGFFRVLVPPPHPTGERDLRAETQRWAIEARSARLHKPHFLDAHSPFLLHVFAKQAATAPDGHVVIHECLPGAEEYTREGGAGRAEEFFVEFTIPGSAHVIG